MGSQETMWAETWGLLHLLWWASHDLNPLHTPHPGEVQDGTPVPAKVSRASPLHICVISFMLPPLSRPQSFFLRSAGCLLFSLFLSIYTVWAEIEQICCVLLHFHVVKLRLIGDFLPNLHCKLCVGACRRGSMDDVSPRLDIKMSPVVAFQITGCRTIELQRCHVIPC